MFADTNQGETMKLQFSTYQKGQPNWLALYAAVVAGFTYECNDNNILKGGITGSTPIPSTSDILADGSLLARVKVALASGMFMGGPVRFFIDAESVGGNDLAGIQRKASLYNNTVAAYESLRRADPTIPEAIWQVYCNTLDDNFYDNINDNGGVDQTDALYLANHVDASLGEIAIEGYAWRNAGQDESQKADWLKRMTAYVAHAREFKKPVCVFLEPYVGDASPGDPRGSLTNTMSYTLWMLQQLDAMGVDYAIPWDGIDEGKAYDPTMPFFQAILTWIKSKMSDTGTTPPVVIPPAAPGKPVDVNLFTKQYPTEGVTAVRLSTAATLDGWKFSRVLGQGYDGPTGDAVPIFETSGDGSPDGTRYGIAGGGYTPSPGWVEGSVPLFYGLPAGDVPVTVWAVQGAKNWFVGADQTAPAVGYKAEGASPAFYLDAVAPPVVVDPPPVIPPKGIDWTGFDAAMVGLQAFRKANS